MKDFLLPMPGTCGAEAKLTQMSAARSEKGDMIDKWIQIGADNYFQTKAVSIRLIKLKRPNQLRIEIKEVQTTWKERDEHMEMASRSA